MTFRSVGAIALRPKNDMGSYYFMSLKRGRLTHSNQWTVLHVTYEVVQQVHDLADQDGVQNMKYGQILFQWEPGMPIQDRHAYEILMTDGEVNNTDMQPLGNVGHDVIIFENEQEIEDDPDVLVTDNEEQADQGERRDSNNGDENSIDMNSDDITDVDKDSINKGVINDEGELIPGEVGRGDITNENDNNIDVPTLE